MPYKYINSAVNCVKNNPVKSTMIALLYASSVAINIGMHVHDRYVSHIVTRKYEKMHRANDPAYSKELHERWRESADRSLEYLLSSKELIPGRFLWARAKPPEIQKNNL